MKRKQFSQNQPLGPQHEQIEPEIHPEPFGHVHPNYRHWTWFRPSHWQQ